jgi:uncharacterized membrane protein
MTWFKPRNLLDRTFEITVIIKGLDGLLEVIGGILLLIVSPATINRLVIALTQHELSGDPHDFIATQLVRFAHDLTGSALLFGALYLLLHGIVKIVLVLAVLRDKLWAYPWMIGFIGLFIVYQLYQMTFAPSLWLAALTLFDIFVVWLTYMEYRKHHRRVNGE